MPHRVLVIDDERGVRESISMILELEGYEVDNCASAVEALGRMDTGEQWDYVVCDIRMPEMDGIEFVRQMRRRGHAGDVIMISAYGSVDTSIEAIKAGASDYINKPLVPDELILRLKMLEEKNRLRLENRYLKQQLDEKAGFEEIVYASPTMRKVVEFASRVAAYKTNVLITGESGTGKELVARAIHKASDRADKPFVAVNCAAIPETLFESELFGYAKGAFSGATGTKRGVIEEADGGTLFLDEIGEFPLTLQPKLLRMLQEEEIRRLGETKSIKVDVRIVAATARDLAREVEEGCFRDDLFYRLNVMHIVIPPLRERKEDIPHLVDHFIRKYNEKFNRNVRGVTPSVLSLLMEHPWYGNVRELENVIERAMIMTERDVIEQVDLQEGGRSDGETFTVESLSLSREWSRLEAHLIRKALKECGNNRTRAAKLLGVSRRALLYKLKHHGIS